MSLQGERTIDKESDKKYHYRYGENHVQPKWHGFSG